jgi:diguanylate cyclase (GGDEF)-like protein/PAS domain S-box-containing protein
MKLLLRAGGSVVLLLWLCLVTWIGFDLRNSLVRERNNATQVAGTLAQALESHLQATVQKIDLRLSEFVDHHSEQIARHAPRRVVEPELAEFLALFPEAQDFAVADAAGNFIYDASSTLATAGIGDRAYFIKLRDDPGAGLVVSEPLESRVTKDWVFVLARRLAAADGRFVGVVLTTVRSDFFERFYSRLDIGRNGVIALWSTELQQVARWPRQDEWRGGKLAGSPILERLAAGETAGSFGRSGQYDKQRRLVVFRKTADLPFVITVGLAEEEFLAEWRRRAIAYALLGTILSLALLALGRSWTRSHARATELARRMTEAYRAKEEEGRALIDAIPDPAWLVDTEARILAINEAFCRMVGQPMDALIGKTTFELFAPETAERLREAQLRVYSENAPVREELWFDVGKGKRPYEFLRVPVYDAAGKPRGLAGVAWDISLRVEAEQRQRLVAQVFENSNEGLLIIDTERRIVLCNRAYERMLGYTSDELVGRDPMMLASPRYDASLDARVREEITTHGSWHGEIWLRAKSGEEVPVWCNVSVVFDAEGKTLNTIIQTADLRERKTAEARIESLATRDQMTGLPNRQGFVRILDAWLAAGHGGALLIFDLDHLGRVNDAFGHEAGDSMLRTTGQRLRRLLREDDALGRLGGDQFGVLTAGRSDAEAVETVVRKLLDAIAQPMPIDGSAVVSTACAGICLFPADGADSAALLRNTDAAMHRAKAGGANQFRFFALSMNEEMAERLRLESDLRGALDRHEFLLHYQPQYELANRRPIGVESLIRWRHPELGIVPPNLFIPLAEETRLILPIGRWVLIEACRQNRAWQDAGLPPCIVAVNLSALQFHDGSIVDQVSEALVLSGLDPRWLELEITESVIMHDPERVAALLGQLKALGVRLSIDDFGTGYSSLAYLKRFPLDKIKIDRSFVTDLEHDPNDAAIVRMVIGIAKELELKVIAEGVETEGQRDFLHRHACDEVQGFLFSRPLPVEAIPAILSPDGPPPA